MKTTALSLIVLLGVLPVLAAPPAPQRITIDISPTTEAESRNLGHDKTGIYVTGSVNKPGLLNGEDGISISEAISRAGGLTRLAFRREVRIYIYQPRLRIQLQIPAGATDEHRNLVLSRFTLTKGDAVFIPELVD